MARINDNSAISTIANEDILAITDINDATLDKKITMAQIKTFSATDITGKQDLITAPTNNNLVTTDAFGQTKDSGIASTVLTTQGNTFNGVSQLVQTTSAGKYPALDGSLITGLYDDSTLFALNSGNVTAGEADIFAYSGTTLSFKTGGSYADTLITYADKTQELNTSLASITGLSTNGTYTILKEKGQNPVAVPTPSLGKDLFVDFSQGNANDNYGLHTPTLIGIPTFTGNKFNSNGVTGLKYPITTLGTGAWVVSGKFKFATSIYQAFMGSSHVSGLVLRKTDADKLQIYLSSNGSDYNIANAYLGTKADWVSTSDYYFRMYFTGTQYKVDWSTDGITWVNDITITSSLTVTPAINGLFFGIHNDSLSYPLTGTMDELKVTIGQSVCQVKNHITTGKTFPLYPVNGNRHCLTATGLQTFEYVTDTWVETQWSYLSPNNGVTVASSVISAVSTQPFNQNGYDVNVQTQGYRFPDYSNGISKALATDYTAECDGWVTIGGSLYDAYNISLLINGVLMAMMSLSLAGIYCGYKSSPVPVRKGDIYRANHYATNPTLTFYPAKGAN